MLLCLCFAVAASIALLPIQNIQVQLLFGWVLGSAGFPVIEQGEAFFGISYDEKRDLERELAPERNNKLRRSLIKGRCTGEGIYRCQKIKRKRLSVANVLRNRT